MAPWITVAIMLVLLFGSAGCSATGALVGEWHVDGAAQKMVQFSNDGRFESTCLGMPAGVFRVTGDGRAIELTGQGTSETLAYSVAGGKMSLSGTLADGSRVRWTLTRAASRLPSVR